MISVEIKKKGKKLDSMLAAIEKLDGQKTEIGYFASQGKHKGSVGIGGYSYAGLAQALELGYFPLSNQPFRKPLPFMNRIVENTFYSLRTSMKYKKAMRSWFKKLDKKGNPQELLDAVGWFAKKQAGFVFNNPAYFPQAPNNKTPIYETGELLNHFTYRTSHDNNVRRT
ncbi:MAG: hypothetical protein GY804_11790 [Alphaproteobacteria bacterium]|nr:hypothetical protein [Alphaproteobacteria bacterium]